MLSISNKLFTSWCVFSLLLNVALMLYLPYTFFFFEALPPVDIPEIITSTLFIIMFIIEIMVKLDAEAFKQNKVVHVSTIRGAFCLRKGILLDLLAVISLIVTYIENGIISPLRLFIYFKIPSILVYDRFICTRIQSMFVQFTYTISKITLIYLTFCNLTAGAFFKLDYYIYSLQGYYQQNGMVWLLSASSMSDILDWSYIVHYLYSMYWSIITACTIGYGDITPLNPYQVILVMFIFVPSILFYGYLIDNVNAQFSSFQVMDQAIMENQVVILRALKDVNAEKKQIRFFKYNIQKMIELEMNEKAVVYNPLSKTLKMELNYQVFRNSLLKIGDLSLEDANILCSHIEETLYQRTQIINPQSKLFYILQGKGNIHLTGLDFSSYQQGSTIITEYVPSQTLNTFYFLSQQSFPFIHYEITSQTRVYQIGKQPILQSLRMKFKQMSIQKAYSKFGIQCQICNSVYHLTSQCNYLSYTQFHKSKGPKTSIIDKNVSNFRQIFKRHDRQNQAIRNVQPYCLLQFQQIYVQQ